MSDHDYEDRFHIDDEPPKILINRCDSRIVTSVIAMIAVTMGAFGVLRLYDADTVLQMSTLSSGNPVRWWGLTIAYWALCLLGGLLLLRARAYSHITQHQEIIVILLNKKTRLVELL